MKVRVNKRKHVQRFIQHKIMRSIAKKKTCLKRQRKNCTGNDDCILFKSNPCEFLHKREDTENKKLLLQENKGFKE